VISPLLANVYLHYVFDLWAERWRRREATGDMIIVRVKIGKPPMRSSGHCWISRFDFGLLTAWARKSPLVMWLTLSSAHKATPFRIILRRC
jgi:hypothetical protein